MVWAFQWTSAIIISSLQTINETEDDNNGGFTTFQTVLQEYFGYKNMIFRDIFHFIIRLNGRISLSE